MLQANDRADILDAIIAAHKVAYETASLFGEYHKLKDGKRYNDPELIVSYKNPVIHGFFGSSLDFISLSALVVGSKLNTRCKCVMNEMSISDIRKLFNKSFAVNKDWRVGDVRVSVKKFMEPIFEFLTNYKDQVEVYTSLYENAATYTDVLGLVIISKNKIKSDKLIWEITIDNADLVNPLSLHGLFCRN